MKLPIKCSFFAVAALLSNFSVASQLNNVSVAAININKGLGEYLFIRTSVAPVQNGCQTDLNWNYVLPLNDALSKNIFSILLAAQTSKAKVTLTGTGTCSPWGIEYLTDITISSN
ncbi:MAG TPA: hypothetical protein VLF09_13885 [Cellvibrio sp.]|nr:hypothetical protein [Cellvibrio sp.]